FENYLSRFGYRKDKYCLFKFVLSEENLMLLRGWLVLPEGFSTARSAINFKDIILLSVSFVSMIFSLCKHMNLSTIFQCQGLHNLLFLLHLELASEKSLDAILLQDQSLSFAF
ncbi:hypothetical protein Tco_0947484, partial [Tanacetum coccineum]